MLKVKLVNQSLFVLRLDSAMYVGLYEKPYELVKSWHYN